MTKQYPNATLHKFVIDNFTHNTGLKLIFLDDKKERSHDGSDQGEYWEYRFGYPGAKTVLKISLHWPKKYVHISLFKGDSSFSFEDYMSHIGKRKELDDIFARTITDKTSFSLEDCALETLRLFSRYLMSDLLKVAKGDEWKEIPIDWTEIR